MRERRPLSEKEFRLAETLRKLWQKKKLESKAKGVRFTQESAAAEMGFETQGAVSQYLTGKIPLNTDAIILFSKVLGISPLEIDPELYNLGLYQSAENSLHSESQSDNYEKLALFRFPLIPIDQAGKWRHLLANHRPADGEIMATKPILGKDLFGVQIIDDDMEPRFIKGDSVIIDPHKQAKHGDFVLVSAGRRVILRELWDDAGEWLLKPLNPRYQIRPQGDACVIGVVRGKIPKIEYFD